MGIGCRRDPLEANVWYVRAADAGDERARQRLALISAASSGQEPGKTKKGKKEKKVKDEGGLPPRTSSLPAGAQEVGRGGGAQSPGSMGSGEVRKAKEDKECVVM